MLEMALERLISGLSIGEESNCENIGVVCVLSELRDRLDGSAGSGKRILGNMVEVFRLGSVCWLFPEFGSHLKICYVSLVKSCIRHSDLRICDTDGGCLPAGSYKDIPERARSVCAVLQGLTQRLGAALNSGDRTSASTARSLIRILSPTLCIFSITHMQDRAWTEESSRTCAHLLLHSWITVTGSGSVLEMLCGDDGVQTKGMFGSIMDSLLPELTK